MGEAEEAEAEEAEAEEAEEEAEAEEAEEEEEEAEEEGVRLVMMQEEDDGIDEDRRGDEMRRELGHPGEVDRP